jgi:CheY-specific phosphatase CheX
MGSMKKMQALLMDSIFEVFEKMFFVFLEPCTGAMGHDLAVSIRFCGSTNGRIDAYLSESLAAFMAQNMLGLNPEEVTDNTREDCAREAVNMIAGNFLNKLDARQVFNLTLPVCEKKPGRFPQDNDAALCLMFDAEERSLGIRLSGEILER